MDTSKASARALLSDGTASKSTCEEQSVKNKLIIYVPMLPGEEFHYDSQFRGPLAKRSCTDVICLMFFFVFLVAFGFAGYYGKFRRENKHCVDDNRKDDNRINSRS